MKTIEQLKAEIKATEDGLYKKVLENNLKATAFTDDVVIAVFAAFNKYAGKKIGDRTIDKINAELQQSIPDIRVYFSWNWDRTKKEGITVTRYNSTHPELDYRNDDIQIFSTNYNTRNLFDENSNFIALNSETARIIGRTTYIEDVESYVNEKTAQFKAVQNCVEQYEKLVKDFRENGVKGLADFKYVSVPHRITE